MCPKVQRAWSGDDRGSWGKRILLVDVWSRAKCVFVSLECQGKGGSRGGGHDMDVVRCASTKCAVFTSKVSLLLLAPLSSIGLSRLLPI